MKFKIDKSRFEFLLGNVARVVQKRGSMEVLNCFLLEAEDDKLFISGTDLNLFEKGSTICEVEEPGALIIPRMVYDILKSMPKGNVSFEEKGELKFSLRSGRSKFDLMAFSPEDYPEIQSVDIDSLVSASVEKLKYLFEHVEHAMSSDITRPHLCSVFLENYNTGKSINAVSTDGHRLAVFNLDIDFSEIGKDSVLIPRQLAIEVKKLAGIYGEVKVGIKEERIFFVFSTEQGNESYASDMILCSRLLESNFPPYKDVIPRIDEMKNILVERDCLLEAVKRVSTIKSYSNVISICFSEGSILVSVNNVEVGSGGENLDIDYTGEEFTIILNSKYLLDALDAIKEEIVSLIFGKPLDPFLITDESKNFISVIMPMRI